MASRVDEMARTVKQDRRRSSSKDGSRNNSIDSMKKKTSKKKVSTMQPKPARKVVEKRKRSTAPFSLSESSSESMLKPHEQLPRLYEEKLN